jgi:hypothetical protein
LQGNNEKLTETNLNNCTKKPHHTFVYYGAELANVGQQIFSLIYMKFTEKNLWKELFHPLADAAPTVLRVVGEEGERKHTNQPLQLPNWWILQNMRRGSLQYRITFTTPTSSSGKSTQLLCLKRKFQRCCSSEPIFYSHVTLKVMTYLK